MKPGSDMSWRNDSSVTVKLPPSSCTSTSRRVESERAAKTRSRPRASFWLTIRFSINADGDLVKQVSVSVLRAGGHPRL